VDQLWLAAGEPDAPPREIPSASRDGERLLDLTWAPDGQHLLLVSQDTGIDPGRLTHLRLFTPPQGPWRDLTSLPGDVVPGSYAWTPDGHHVAFLARTDRALALGILGTDDGRYRYVADLGAGSAQILPFPPLVWSPDSRRLVYAAADTSPARATGWFFGGRPPDHLYVADLDRPAVQPLGSAQGEAPVWWSPEGVPGQVVALARPKSGGPLVVRLVDPDGQSRDLVELGALPPATSFTARWDPGHARAIIATGDPGGLASDETSFWIESLRDEVS
jgi:dipeptidyl aminopeptidase/acylaminoacyl peptidase